MKNNLLAIILLLTASSFSQINFEKGYIINNNNNKNICYIKNIDWKNNPTIFEYKFKLNGKVLNGSIDNIKEFRVDGSYKYIRKIVHIDTSSLNLFNLSHNRNPEFKKQKVFLKTLIQGKANLYMYQKGNRVLYYFNVNNDDIKPLIYKKYLVEMYDPKTGVTNEFERKNITYKQQILNNLNCPDITLKNIESLQYKKNDLVELFSKYNKCKNSKEVNYVDLQKRDLFNLNLRLGARNASLTVINYSNSNLDKNFSNKISLIYNLEAEFIMPFNNNKWTILLSPVFQKYKLITTEKLNNISNTKREINIDYQSIELQLGIRYYIFLNNDIKLFVDGNYIIDKVGNSYIQYEGLTKTNIDSQTNMGFGAGIKYKKYIAEIRVQSNRNILNGYIAWNSSYKNMSLYIGYTLF